MSVEAVLSLAVGGLVTLLVALCMFLLNRVFNRIDKLQETVNHTLSEVATLLAAHGERIARLETRGQPWDIDRTHG